MVIFVKYVMIKRALTDVISGILGDGKVIIIYGPRQTGKTTLLKENFEDKDTLWMDGDDFDVRELLTHTTSTALSNLLQGKKRLIIDEAQHIPGIGHTLKQIHDHVKGIQVLVTGSSSFEISSIANEPLTGRKWEFHLYPFSVMELVGHQGLLAESRLLEQRLIYGFYPEIVTHPADAQKRLVSLVNSYLYKDILKWQEIKKPVQLEKLLQALAFQVGHEVSFNELAQLTGLTNETVQRYIDLLEKSFVIFSLTSFSRNLRNEIKRGKKIYFYDNGIRNAIIKQFQPLALRNDIGPLWENFLIMERLKYKSTHQLFTNDYFWRTHAQQELDFIEEYNGLIHAFEFKWNERKKKSISLSFASAYPSHTYHVISRQNYMDFITGKLD